LIEDEDVRRKCINHLRNDYAKDDDRTPNTFHRWINKELLPDITEKRVSLRTVYRWIHICNFEKTDVKKGVFHDRHEAPDVVVERVQYQANEPDFRDEKTMVQKAVENRGHLFIKSPRFHCELQYIEPFWGNTKRYMRANCSYNINALRRMIPEALRITTVQTIKRYYNRCLRFMDAYRHGLNVQLAHYVTKKYKSHRRLNDLQINVGLEEQEMIQRQRKNIEQLHQ
jgi:hypothetical protein